MTQTTYDESFSTFLANLEALPAKSRLEESDTEAIYYLAYQFVAQGNIEEAYRYFSFLMLYRPTNVKYLSGLALSHKLLKRYKAATAVYSFISKIEPADPRHLLYVAECQLLNGESKNALENLALVKQFCEKNSGNENTKAHAEAITSLLTHADESV